MLLGIDTSESQLYSGVVVGRRADVLKTYASLVAVFKTINWSPPLHWRKIARKGRLNVKNQAIQALAESPLSFLIFRHRKPPNYEKKKYYLRYVPNEISASLEPMLKKRWGTATVECDNDYSVKGVPESTNAFAERLVSQLAYRIHGGNVTVKKAGGSYAATIKQVASDKNLEIFAKSVSSESSKAVQIADVLLGLYSLDNRAFEPKRIRYRIID